MSRHELRPSPGIPERGAGIHESGSQRAPTFFRAPNGARFQQMTPDGQVIHEITDDDVIRAIPEPTAAHPRRREDDEPLRKRRQRN